MTGTNQETFDKIKIKFLLIIVFIFTVIMVGQYFGFVPLFVSGNVSQPVTVDNTETVLDGDYSDEYIDDDYEGVYSDFSEYDLGFDDGYFYGYDDGYFSGYEEAKEEYGE